ncbi:type IV pilus assembly protein PilM [Thalassoroseus pseudoceratinae]|uniref:type IV pilus assembly protein PilM n=1 Tax=Thalassoroseus pseudoceratinae TaxID=2713176 RepID=UPI001420DD2F|nr:type IV pilus assembly protein PilM [Thalassoroseus pseudoceratinae]
MAETGGGVWGIEIGQAGLKAVRLRYAEAANQVVAVAFDYIAHPKILSQPDAVPEELIPQALTEFLSRNTVQGDQVVISVPGQTALAKFVNLPPVPGNKVAEIVKYEAKQTIPFALEDVIWDYQVLSAGSEESDFLLDAEVGIFAMKRDEIAARLKYFQAQKIEPDGIQMAPLALYNMVSYDKMGLRLDGDKEPTDEYNIVLDMGADNTTLVVTNGAKIWIRNVPIGGNHFTRALTKEMKLTFAKAEHLKCNATKAPDPRAVFQALRPVFNDYVSEIQRSIGYFSSVNRSAKIKQVIGVGNGFKLAGLQKFLHQNLQYDVVRLSKYDELAGDAVTGSSMFQENILTFAVPYGLALQGLKLTRIHTTLLPPEIVTARKIRAKKPWAAAAAAALLGGIALSGIGFAQVAKSVSEDRFGDAEKAVENFQSKVSGYQSSYQAEQSTHAGIMEKGAVLIQNLESRTQWLELYKAINEALPKEEVDSNQSDLKQQNRIHIQSITQEHMDDLKTWYAGLSETAALYMKEADRKPPEGPGFVVTIRGYHFHANGHKFQEATFLKNLQDWRAEDGFPIREIGISHATLIDTQDSKWLYNPDLRIQKMLESRQTGGGRGRFGEGGGPMRFNPGNPMEGGGPGSGLSPEDQKLLDSSTKVTEWKFVLQFVWQPTPLGERDLNNLLWQLLSQNPEATMTEATEQVTAYNEELKKRKLVGEDTEKQEIELTEEKFTAFKTKHFDTEAVMPSAAAPTMGGGGMDGGGGMMPGGHGGY